MRLLAPSGPPLNIRITARSTSSLSFDWDLPETSKQNGVIISYTACVSHSENGPCFQIFITNERKWLVGDLNPSTKYYVRVLASTKVGHGKYSESEGYFTLGSKYNMYISKCYFCFLGKFYSEFHIHHLTHSFWITAALCGIHASLLSLLRRLNAYRSVLFAWYFSVLYSHIYLTVKP